MDELTIGDKIYISSKKAAEITGYAKDYVGQLCREGRVEATLVGRSWYVLESSIREHRFGKEEKESILEDLESETASPGSVSYVSEVPQMLPELTEREEIVKEPEERQVKVESSSGENGVANMQSVWKEWFERRSGEVEVREPEQNLVKPIYTPVEEVKEELEYQNQEEEYQKEPEPEPVPIVRSKPVYQPTTYAYDIVPKTAPMRHEEPREERYYHEEPIRSTEGIKKARRNEEKGEPSSFSPVLLRAVFIGIAILVVSLTVIASGFVSRANIQNSVLSSIVEYLGGTRILNK